MEEEGGGGGVAIATSLNLSMALSKVTSPWTTTDRISRRKSLHRLFFYSDRYPFLLILLTNMFCIIRDKFSLKISRSHYIFFFSPSITSSLSRSFSFSHSLSLFLSTHLHVLYSPFSPSLVVKFPLDICIPRKKKLKSLAFSCNI